MARIFISYRRADSAAESGRIYDRLAAAFGDDNVFKDVDDIPAGEDFRAVLEREVSRCDVLLAVMGSQWATITDEDGRRRLHDPNDFVNIEVEAGLSRSDVLVIPILVGSTSMPSPEQLPENLRSLCYRNAVPVRNDPDFNRDVQRLIERIRAYSDKRPAPAAAPVTKPSRLPIYLSALAVAVVLIALAFIVTQPGSMTQIIPTNTPAVSSPVPTQPPTDVPVVPTQAPSAAPLPTAEPLLIAQAVATTLENARVWSGPDVLGNSEATDLPVGTQLVILDGPMRGNIRLDANIQGDWYEVRRLDETTVLGWIWAERLTLTDDVRLTEQQASDVMFTRSLYETSPRLSGPDVLRLQGRLRALGYPLAVVDGYYGPLTANAVQQFQQRNSLTADSAVDGVTWNRLFSAEAVSAG